MIETTVSQESPEGWDAFLLWAGKEANLTQSRYWADVLTRRDGAIPMFVRAEMEGERLGQALFMLHCDGGKPSRQVSARCIAGPVLTAGASAAEALGSILLAFEASRPLNVGSVRIQPTPASDLFRGPLREVPNGQGYEITNWGTYLVDLSHEEETLFRNLVPAARKCVNKCRRNGVTIRKMQDFEEFRDVYWGAFRREKEREGATVREPSPIPFQMDVEERYGRYAAMSADGHVLACLGMYVFNGVATEIASVMTSEARALKLPAQDFLHWEMMLEAKKLGCHTFDLAGVNPNPQTDKEKGILRFKKKWGGRYVEYPVFTKYYPSLLGRVRMKAGEFFRFCRGER